jgi:hypothetical protein
MKTPDRPDLTPVYASMTTWPYYDSTAWLSPNYGFDGDPIDADEATSPGADAELSSPSTNPPGRDAQARDTQSQDARA